MVLTAKRRTIPSSSVHHNVTTVRRPISRDYRAFLSVHYPKEIKATEKLFDLLHYGPGHPRRNRFDNCRHIAWFVRHKETGQVRVRSLTCGDRYCPMCARAKRMTIATNVHHWIKTTAQPKHLILTIKTTGNPIQEQLARLYAAFTALRQTKRWKQHVRGGVWFLHCHYRLTPGHWYPHLHCIIDSDYFPQKVLSNLWEKITKGSFVTWIRAINQNDKIAAYVAREAAKPVNLHELTDEQLVSVYSAFYGRKLFGAFGAAVKLKLLAQPRRVREDWESVGSWGTVWMLSAEDERARQIMTAWLAKKPLAPGINITHIDDVFDDVPREIQPEPPPRQLFFEADSCLPAKSVRHLNVP